MAKQTPGSKCDTGSKYELSVTALFASLLSKNENVEDYRIFSNLADAQPFDDIVAEVQFKGLEHKQIYAIQVKSGRDKLNINKYWKGYDKIMREGGLKLGECIRNNHIQFYYVCSKTPTNNSFPLETSTSIIELTLRPRSNPCNLYQSIFSNTVHSELFSEDLSIIDYQNFFDNFSLFLNQSDTQKNIYNIKGIWKIDDPVQILSYMENYFAKNTSGLDKRAFEHELLRNRLSSYMVIPTTAIQFHHEAVEEWNRLTLKQDVTIVRNELNIERYLFGCILQNICSVISVNEWNRSVRNMGKLDHDVRNRLKTKTSKPETLKDLVVRIWIDGKAPLLLRTDIALPFMQEFSHLHKNYVIIDSDVDKRYGEIESYGLSAFRHLGDVGAGELMNSILVSVQGRKPHCLSSIINGDRKLMESVTCADVINLMKPRETYLKQDCLDGNNSILFIIETTNPQQQNYDECHPMGNNIANYCGPGESYENYKRIRGDSTFRSYAIFCLRSTDDERLTLLRKRKEHLTAQEEEEEEQILNDFFVDQYGESIYNTKSGNPIPIVGEALIRICSKYIPRYLRQVKDSEVNSLSGGDSSKSEIIYNSKRFAENDFFKESAGTLTVITGEPGVGKTTLLHSLSSLCKSQYYVIFVSLTRCQVDLHERNPKFLQNPLRFWCNKHGTLPYSRFLTNLCDYHDRIVLLLDAFDEVIVTCKEQTLEFIQSLQKIGLKKIIITSRLTFISLLTDKFKTEIFLIEGFNEQFNKHYIENWNLNFNSLSHLPSEFLTNPLYLNMLKAISDNGINLDAVTNRWSLYKNIVALKMQEYCRRVKPNLLDEIEKYNILSYHWLLALETVFGSCNVRQKLGQTKPAKQTKHNKFMNLGFITHFDTNESPIFVHHTFAEFFVLQWLIENIDDDNAASTYMLMLNSKMHMLDMLSEQFRLHKAILHESVEKIEKLCTEHNNYLLEVDDLGRSVLHLAAITCSRDYFHKSNRLNVLLHRMRKKGFDIYVRDKIMNWTWINYWENYVYVPKCWKDEHVATLEAYLGYYATHIKELKHSKFSLGDHFNRLYNAAIKYSSIDMIRDLLFLKYHDDKVFLESRDILLHPRMVKKEEFLNVQFRGEDLKGAHLACIYSNVEAVKMYVENRENLNKTDTFNCTPLHYSVISRENSEIVELLLANSDISNPYAGQENHTTILHISVRAGNTNVTRMLLESVDPNLKDADNSTALSIVIESSKMNFGAAPDSQYLETIEMLLQYKADPNLQSLDLAIMYGRKDILQILMKYGANVSINDNTLLYKAIEGGNLEIIEPLLKGGAWINYTDLHGRNPLSYAIEGGSKDVVQMLLNYNADVNLKNRRGRTPLYKGIYFKNFEMIELLLRRGAHVNFLDLNGCSPLSYAIDVGNKDIVQMLLNYDADVNLEIQALNSATHNGAGQIPSKYSTVPLYEAIEKRDLEIIELLLKCGASVNILDSLGWSPLGYAAHIGNKDIVEMLLTYGADVNFKDNNNGTPLYKAIARKHLEIIELLLKRGAEKNILNSTGWSPLCYAIHKGNKDTVEMLLTYGAEANFKGINHFAPLYSAIKANDLEIIELLLKRDGHVNILDSSGGSPLSYAVHNGNKDTVEMLLSYGAEVNFKNNDDTPLALYSAIRKKDLEIIELILKSGAHLNTLNSAEWSPLRYAIHIGNKTTVEMLLAYGADVDFKNNTNHTALYTAIGEKGIEIIELLLKCDARLNILDSFGWSPLGHAVQVGTKDAIEMLLSYGADVNFKNNNNHTPLYFAIEKKNMEVIGLLLKSGAHVNILDVLKRSPLVRAVHIGNKDTVEMLLIHGADVNFKNNNNRTALYTAIEETRIEIIELLLKSGAHINILDSTGWSPLSYAIHKGNKDTVEMLVTYGAEVNFKNNNDTPLYSVQWKTNLEISELILMSSAPLNNPNSLERRRLCFALHISNRTTVETFLTYAADVNLKYNNNHTGLYTAIEKKSIEVIELLLKSGAHINILDLWGWSPLGHAVRVGAKNIIEILLNYGADVNFKNNNNHTPLYIAIKKRNMEIIEWLLKSGAHVNILNSAKWSPLCYAIYIGYKDTIEMLLTHGADVNFKNYNNHTALYTAIWETRIEIIELLLKSGAHVNILDALGWSPLGYAIHIGNQDTVEMLLIHGADLNFQDNKNGTPLHNAIEKSNLGIVELLLKWGARVNNLDALGWSPLGYVVHIGNKDIVKMLLTYGADVNIKDSRNRTPLHHAIKSTDLEIIELLLRRGAYINILDSFGWSPLDHAVQVGTKDAIEMLLSYGADVNFKNYNNHTALYTAIWETRIEIIELLLKSGAHVNILDALERSPLLYAVHIGNKDTVEMLLTHGADLNFQDNKNRTPLHIAIENSNLGIVELLLKCGTRVNNLDALGWSLLGYAVHIGNKDTVEMLLTYGADVNIKDSRNRTPLYHAIKSTDLEIIELLLRRGAHINILDSLGWSPLSYAVHIGNKDTVEILLANGADVNIEDNSSRTPLYHAIEIESLEGIEVLLKHGARVNILNSWGWSPMSYAVDVGNRSIIKELLAYKYNANAQIANSSSRTRRCAVL